MSVLDVIPPFRRYSTFQTLFHFLDFIRFFLFLSDIMDLGHQSSAMCIIMLWEKTQMKNNKISYYNKIIKS